MKIESAKIVVIVVQFSNYEWKSKKLLSYNLLYKYIETSATPTEKKKQHILCYFSRNDERLLVTIHPSLLNIPAWPFMVMK